MIGASRGNETCTFVGAPPDGMTAFVDLDWISRETRPEPVHALVVSDSDVRYGETSSPAASTEDPERQAILRLSAIARLAVAAIRPTRDGSVAVIGDGLIALTARSILGTRLADVDGEAGALTAAIDFTGRSSGIEAAMRLVVPLGTVVLAGVRSEALLPVNMYRDAHLRGLHLIGVEPLLAGGDEAMPKAGVFDLAVPRATVVTSTTSRLAPWYSVTSAVRASHEL